MSQPNLHLEDIRKLKVPILGMGLQKSISHAVNLADKCFSESRLLTQEAELTLLRALGLEGWQPPEPLTYTRRASEAFAANRIDADYWSPAKYSVLASLANLPHRLLSDYCEAVREMFEPMNAAAGEQVRNFDVTDALQPVLDDEKEIVSAAEIGSAKKRFQFGDVVISRLRAYLREIALVRTSPVVPAIGSSEFIVLRPRSGLQAALAPETLMIFLRSQPVQTVLKFCRDGSHHPRFGEEDLLSIPVPDLVIEASGIINDLVNAALAARHKARALLERARRAVEVAIEESEETAPALLDSEEE